MKVLVKVFTDISSYVLTVLKPTHAHRETALSLASFLIWRAWSKTLHYKSDNDYNFTYFAEKVSTVTVTTKAAGKIRWKLANTAPPDGGAKLNQTDQGKVDQVCIRSIIN